MGLFISIFFFLRFRSKLIFKCKEVFNLIYRKMICVMNFFFVIWIGLFELKFLKKKNEEEFKFLNIFVY